MMNAITGLKYVMFAHAFASLMRRFRVFKASEIFFHKHYEEILNSSVSFYSVLYTLIFPTKFQCM